MQQDDHLEYDFNYDTIIKYTLVLKILSSSNQLALKTASEGLRQTTNHVMISITALKSLKEADNDLQVNH